MFDKAFDKVTEMLSTPLLIAVFMIGLAVAIIGVAIYLKGKGKEHWNPLEDKGLKKFVKIVLFVCLLIYTGYFTYFMVTKNLVDVVFESNETGIYICPFEEDDKGMVAKDITYAISDHKDKDPQFKNVRVALSNLDRAPEEHEVMEICRKRNASLLLTGRYRPNLGEQYYLHMFFPDGKRQVSQNPLPLKDHTQLIARVFRAVAKQKQPQNHHTPGPQDQDPWNVITKLQYKYTKLNARLEKLEKAGTASRTTQASPGKEWKRYALLIGIDEYKSPELRKLQFSEKDTAALKKALKKVNYDINASPPPLTGKDATKANIEQALKKLNNLLTPEDSVLIYFAGHSQTIPINGKDTGVLCPYDFDPHKPAWTGITAADLETWVNGLHSTEVVILMDSCFAGAFTGNTARSGRALKNEIVPFTPPGSTASKPARIHVPLSKKNRVLITAGKGDEEVVESPRWKHGIFTGHLLKALNGSGDMDEDGLIDADELYYFLKRKVRDASGNYQHPRKFVHGSEDISIALLPNSKNRAGLYFKKVTPPAPGGS